MNHELSMSANQLVAALQKPASELRKQTLFLIQETISAW